MLRYICLCNQAIQKFRFVRLAVAHLFHRCVLVLRVCHVLLHSVYAHAHSSVLNQITNGQQLVLFYRLWAQDENCLMAR